MSRGSVRPRALRSGSGMSRDKDPAPVKAASIEVGDGINCRFEWVDLGVQSHPALSRQRHEFGEIVISAHQVADEIDLVGDYVDSGKLEHSSVSDDEVASGLAEH